MSRRYRFPLGSFLFGCLLVLSSHPSTSWAAGGNCFLTATPLSFGTYDMLSPIPRDATAQFNIRCTNQPKNPLTVTLSLTTGNGSYAQRLMLGSNGGALIYNIFLNAGLSQVLGDGTGGSTTISQTIDKTTPWTVTLFGRIPASQSVPVGAYTDTLVGTIVW